MASKAPKTGDVVKAETLPTFGVGVVERCEGIYLYVRWLRVPHEGHSGIECVRRDSVEVLSYANRN